MALMLQSPILWGSSAYWSLINIWTIRIVQGRGWDIIVYILFIKSSERDKLSEANVISILPRNTITQEDKTNCLNLLSL